MNLPALTRTSWHVVALADEHVEDGAEATAGCVDVEALAVREPVVRGPEHGATGKLPRPERCRPIPVRSRAVLCFSIRRFGRAQLAGRREAHRACVELDVDAKLTALDCVGGRAFQIEENLESSEPSGQATFVEGPG